MRIKDANPQSDLRNETGYMPAAAMDEFRVEIWRTWPADPQLVADWDALVLCMEAPQIFYTTAWAKAVVETFGGREPLLICVHDGARLLGVAAMAETRADPGTAIFLCDQTADYCDFVSTPQNRLRVVGAVLEQLRHRGFRLRLRNLPEQSATSRVLAEAARAVGLHVVWGAKQVCPVLTFATSEQRGEVQRSINAKQSTRRHLKVLAKQGEVTARHEGDWATIAPQLEQFVQGHITRFLATGRISPVLESERQSFLRRLLPAASERQWAVFSTLHVGGEAIAWVIGFVFGESWFWYMPTFDIAYEKQWPGEVLLSLVLQAAVTNPCVTRVDFGICEEFYKTRYANERRFTREVVLCSDTWRAAAYALRTSLAEFVKRSSAIGQVVRRIRDALDGARRRLRSDGMGKSARRAAQRVVDALYRRDEVVVFKAPSAVTHAVNDLRLKPLDWKRMAHAAWRYADDAETLAYLLRCARRKREHSVEGFVLLDREGVPVNFAWVAGFDGFHIGEVEYTWGGAGDASVIFDCWTPARERGRGHYPVALRELAGRIQARGQAAWIYCDAQNTASILGIAKAGFKPANRIVRRRLLGLSRRALLAPGK